MNTAISMGHGCRSVPALNAHIDYDECPCAGPYQLTGLSGRENFGVVVAESAADAVAGGQGRNPEVFHAIALDPDDGPIRASASRDR